MIGREFTSMSKCHVISYIDAIPRGQAGPTPRLVQGGCYDLKRGSVYKLGSTISRSSAR